MLLQKEDPDIYWLIYKELSRQRENIELIASENIVSRAVLQANGSILTNKYAEGYPGKRYYGGCEYIDEVEQLAIDRAKKLFNCNFANVQPHSGAQANMAVLMALCNQGDTILSMSLDAGGHLSHGYKLNFSGKYFNVVNYGVDDEGLLNYNQVEQLAKECKPKLIVAGASAYPREINFKRFKEIADEVGALLWVDMAHIAGLVATGNHMSPIPYADVVTSTTHKTLRGPRGGLILWNNEEYNFNSALFPGTQGGPLENTIAAKAVCFKEALSEDFKIYQNNVVINAKELASQLKKYGFNLISGGTDNHLMLIDLTNFNITGKEMQNNCELVNVTLNKNAIPNDPRSPFITSGVRIGTPAITTRGFELSEMEKVASILYDVVNKEDNNKIRRDVRALTEAHPIYID